MDITHIYPSDFFYDIETSIPLFFDSMLMRSNFSLHTKSLLGWKGIHPATYKGKGWTCMIKNSKGVYAINFEGCQTIKSGITGEFSLFYFPQCKENIIDFYPDELKKVIQDDDYEDYIRHFGLYSELSAFFRIADINLFFSDDMKMISHSFVAKMPEWSSLSASCDSGFKIDFFKLARDFYEVLGYTISWNLKESPVLQYALKKNNSDNTLGNRNISGLQMCYGEWDIDKRFDLSDFYLPEGYKIDNSKQNLITDSGWWKSDSTANLKHIVIPEKEINRPELIMLTGFLGSGKTSFLKHFIEYHTVNSRFVAVIQNEIGQQGIDSKLLEDNYAVLEMDEGCVCCSLIGQLKKGVDNIIKNFNPDIVILETTGLANPANILYEINDIEGLIRFSSIVTVVDALHFTDTAAENIIAYDQVLYADKIVINKTDLVNKNKIGSLQRLIKEINPLAQQFNTCNGDINPAVLFNEGSNKMRSEKNSSNVAKTHADLGLISKQVTVNGRLSKDKFENLMHELPEGVLRAKGIVRFNNTDRTYMVQYVSGDLNINEIEKYASNEYFMIFIGKADIIGKIILNIKM